MMAKRGTGKTRRRRRGWRLLLVVGLLGLGYLLVLSVQIFLAGLPRPAGRADVIVVLGASQADGRPNPVLRARLRHAVDLYQDGAAPALLFCGGRQPGDRFTEAQAGRFYALQRGVPDADIVLENEGRTTLQSLQRVAAIVRANGFHRVILVSDPYHGFRLLRMARDLGMDATFSGTPYTRIRTLPTRAKFIVREAGAYVLYRTLGM